MTCVGVSGKASAGRAKRLVGGAGIRFCFPAIDFFEIGTDLARTMASSKRIPRFSTTEDMGFKSGITGTETTTGDTVVIGRLDFSGAAAGCALVALILEI